MSAATAILDRPEHTAPAGRATTLDLRWMTVLHLAVSLYSSEMPDRLKSVKSADPAALVEWAEQGLAKVGVADIMTAVDHLGALMDSGKVEFVYGRFLPSIAGVQPSMQRRRTAMRSAWYLLAHLDSERHYDLSQVR